MESHEPKTAALSIPDHLVLKSPCGHSVSDVPHGIWFLASELSLPDVMTRAGKKRMMRKMGYYCRLIADYCFKDHQENQTRNMAAVSLTLLQIAYDTVMRPLLAARAELFIDCWPKLIPSRGCGFGLVCGLMLAHSLARTDGFYPAVHDALYAHLRTVADELLAAGCNCVHTMLCVRVLGLCVPVQSPDPRVVVNSIVGLLGLPPKMSATTFSEFFATMRMVCEGRVNTNDKFSMPVLRFMVGTACSADAVTRKSAFSLIMGLPSNGSDRTSSIYDAETPTWNTTTFLDNYYAKQVRAGVSGNEGSLQGDCHKLVESIEEVATAMREFCETRDDVHLALRLCELIRNDSMAVSFEESCSSRFGFGSNLTPRECGFPFEYWPDTLSFAASVIDSISPSDLLQLPDSKVLLPAGQIVEILRIQHTIVEEDYDQACEMSHAAVTRFPDELFFHYGTTLQMNVDESDAAAGTLKSFLNRYPPGAMWSHAAYQMLASNTALCAFLLAMQHNIGIPPEQEWATVSRLVMRAYSTASDYLANTTPTSRDRVPMRAIQFLTGCLIFRDIRHPSVTLGLTWDEMQKHWDSLTSTSISIYGELRTDKSVLKLIGLFLKHGQAANTIWGSMLREKTGARDGWCDEGLIRVFQAGDLTVHADSWTEEDVRAWRQLIEVRDQEHFMNWHLVPQPLLWTVMIPHHCTSHLHSCSGCGEASSLLRKCAACREVHYCTVECQSKDWKARHRSVCSGAFRDC